MKRMKTLLLFLTMMFVLGACSNDDDDVTRIKVRVAVRVDYHVPPSVTVFGHRIPLSNDNWLITLENFRTYEQKISVPTDAIKQVPSGPLRSDSPDLAGILNVEVEQGDSIFTVETLVENSIYLFILH